MIEARQNAETRRLSRAGSFKGSYKEPTSNSTLESESDNNRTPTPAQKIRVVTPDTDDLPPLLDLTQYAPTSTLPQPRKRASRK